MSGQSFTSDRQMANFDQQERIEQVNAILEEIVALNFRLRSAADQLHAGSGLSGAMRGVLRDLNKFGPQTVPQMARRRSVSRQHIQAIVNDLLRREYVYLRDNPAHKRSRLVEMTRAGQKVFEEMRAREDGLIVQADLPATDDELVEARDVIYRLRKWLEAEQRKKAYRSFGMDDEWAAHYHPHE